MLGFCEPAGAIEVDVGSPATNPTPEKSTGAWVAVALFGPESFLTLGPFMMPAVSTDTRGDVPMADVPLFTADFLSTLRLIGAVTVR